jgi:uncharacterized protein (TIGR03435 family)
MSRALVVASSVALLAQLLSARPASAQDGQPRFDVASMRPYGAPDDVIFALQFHAGGRLTATGTLRMLIRTAYRLQDFQLEGARGWIDDERFDIDARAGRNAPPDEMRLMLRALLAERFALVLRPERREASVYALRVAKVGTGDRVRPAVERCAGACDIRFAPGVLRARGVTMAMLAGELSWWVDRMVIDRTALGETFDLDLEWAPDTIPPAPTPSSTPDPPVAARLDRSAPSIFTAVREQLGLSLEPERGAVDVWVIERAERPGSN